MTSDRALVNRLGSAGRAFFGRFHELREVQRQSIAPISSGLNTLVSSATASGKTEAIFAPLIAHIAERGLHRGSADILILAVAPTRALVNDLHMRLQQPLAEIGWTCGRQTSDHRDKQRRPNVLITTPESFDSMLARDGVWEDGLPVGHLLASVEALFIDEAHLFESSPRGDQLMWMAERLRRLRSHALRNGWATSEALQACAASATVANADELARRLLGRNSTVIQVPGSREMELKSKKPTPEWAPLDELGTLDAIYDTISMVAWPDPDYFQETVRHIWASVQNSVDTGCRKVLVFVPTRALCDRLSLALRDSLTHRRDLFVGAHHGSLERALRESAEETFARSRDAILVATTTLEVGIDIGDVDVVALVGAPPDTSSLLQRVGRSGRRNGTARVLPIVRSPIEGRALASMLESACRGNLEPPPAARLWSVFVQQAASFIAQNRQRGRRREDLLELAQETWPEQDGPITASRVLDTLIEQNALTEAGGRLYLGEEWSNRLERAGGDFHHNFDSPGQGIPVVDASTGELVSHVPLTSYHTHKVALAGRRWDVVSQLGEILIASTPDRGGETTFQYATRAAPTGKRFAEHLRRGLGFEPIDAPTIASPNGVLWFHFGGSAYEAVLSRLLPNLKHVKGLHGIALKGSVTSEDLLGLVEDASGLTTLLQGLASNIALPATLGRYHHLLPDDVQAQVALDYLDPGLLTEWIRSRRVNLQPDAREAEVRLRDAMGW